MSDTRVCLFTGASGLLGTAFLRLYAHRFDVAAVYSSHLVPQPPPMSWHIDPLDPESRRVKSNRLETFRADLTNPEAIARVVDEVLARFKRIDCLINAAAFSRWVPMLDREFECADVTRMFDLNAVVPLRLAIELARRHWHNRFAENTERGRNIVNVSSTASAYVHAGHAQGGYAASKAALNMLTCHMAEEFAPLGVRVNAIAPDSFPSRVSTESVCDAIARLDAGSLSGKILLLETEGETVL